MPRTNPGRGFLKVLAIIGLGAAIGIADARVRPIKLGRTVVQFDPTPAPPAPPRGADPTPVDPASPTTPTPPSSPSNPAAPPPPNPAPSPTGFQFTPADKLPSGHITVDQARTAFDRGASFIDARKKESYEEGHVQGALRMDLASFASGDPPTLALVARDAEVVVYCSGGHCDESERVAELLDNSGYQKVFIMHDGFPGWKAAGHAVETGEGIQ